MTSNFSVRVNAVYKQYVNKKKNNTVSEWIFWWKINPVHSNMSLCCFILLLIQIADADLRVSDINTAYIGRVLWNMSSDVWVPLEDVTSRQMSNNPATANSAEREKEREGRNGREGGSILYRIILKVFTTEKLQINRNLIASPSVLIKIPSFEEMGPEIFAVINTS